MFLEMWTLPFGVYLIVMDSYYMCLLFNIDPGKITAKEAMELTGLKRSGFYKLLNGVKY